MEKEKTSIIDRDLLFAPISDEKTVIVAVSGGGDSMALLDMAIGWARRADRPEIVAVTVDHGLRAGSAREADQVAGFCKASGIRHILKKWCGQKPASGVSARAREVRYQLLAEAANHIGAKTIMLAHNRDDQHETVLMRAGRGKAVDFTMAADKNTGFGLAGIRPVATYCGPPDYQPVQLFRPLLGVPGHQLREYLSQKNISWIDDPTNVDQKYERARLRKSIGDLQADLSARDAVLDFSDEVAKLRKTAARLCAKFIDAHVCMSRCGVITIDEKGVSLLDENLAVGVFRALIAIAGGQKYQVSADRISNLQKLIANDTGDRQTIGGTVVERSGKKIRLWREFRNLDRVSVTPDMADKIEWDGRIVYLFGQRHKNQQLVMAPLGQQGLGDIEALLGKKVKCNPRRALWSQPALFIGNQVVLAPQLGWCRKGFVAPTTTMWTPALELFSPDCDKPLLRSLGNLRENATPAQFGQ